MTNEIKIIKIIFIILFLETILIFNYTLVSAYSIEDSDTVQNSPQPQIKQIDINTATQEITDSISNVVDNVLKSFSSDQTINIQNIPKTTQLSNFNENNQILSQGAISVVTDMIKLSVNLLFATISIVVVILKTLLNSLNSYGG